MIDRRTEENIKDLKGFLESWVKFHELYSDLVSSKRLTGEDEALFFETKGIMVKKYESLKSGLEFKYVPHSRLTDPVDEICSLEGMSNMSEKRLKKIGCDWDDSYVFINRIIERLKTRKRKLEAFSATGVWFKRLLEKMKEGKR